MFLNIIKPALREAHYPHVRNPAFLNSLKHTATRLHAFNLLSFPTKCTESIFPLLQPPASFHSARSASDTEAGVSCVWWYLWMFCRICRCAAMSSSSTWRGSTNQQFCPATDSSCLVQISFKLSTLMLHNHLAWTDLFSKLLDCGHLALKKASQEVMHRRTLMLRNDWSLIFPSHFEGTAKIPTLKFYQHADTCKM